MTLNPSSFEGKTKCNIGRIVCGACTFHLRWPSYPTQSEENAKCNKGFILMLVLVKLSLTNFRSTMPSPMPHFHILLTGADIYVPYSNPSFPYTTHLNPPERASVGRCLDESCKLPYCRLTFTLVDETVHIIWLDRLFKHVSCQINFDMVTGLVSV